ncbi:morphogenetic protein [Klebsiella pneumoniae]|nr:morphogenetic protein [Klebsiella pneumoniae]SPX53020.1 morphogenetic protein [Klebsiella pneumoniae]SVS44869.1 morphogenetic protein [Klebsiella pneumoniae]
MIFNAEMVRALLSGRKTQTRRIIKPQPEATLSGSLSGKWLSRPLNGLLLPKIEDIAIHCPFGSVGDRIWVREAFRVHSRATDVATLVYKASERNSWTEQTRRVPVAVCNKPATPEKWTPSLHMPRWASRILLEITGVRVERLRSMSQDDARAEGVIAASGPMEAGLAFRELWDSIYGEESWKANPWVWVIEFKRVEGGAA